MSSVKFFCEKYDLDMTLTDGLDFGTTESSYHKKYTYEIWSSIIYL